MKDKFLITKLMKNYILSLDKIIINLPKRERVLKEKIINDSYLILELAFQANLFEEKKDVQIKILSKLSMLDFYFEKCYKYKYISEKQFNKVTTDLTKLSKMIFGWMKNEKLCNSK